MTKCGSRIVASSSNSEWSDSDDERNNEKNSFRKRQRDIFGESFSSFSEAHKDDDLAKLKISGGVVDGASKLKEKYHDSCNSSSSWSSNFNDSNASDYDSGKKKQKIATKMQLANLLQDDKPRSECGCRISKQPNVAEGKKHTCNVDGHVYKGTWLSENDKEREHLPKNVEAYSRPSLMSRLSLDLNITAASEFRCLENATVSITTGSSLKMDDESGSCSQSKICCKLIPKPDSRAITRESTNLASNVTRCQSNSLKNQRNRSRSRSESSEILRSCQKSERISRSHSKSQSRSRIRSRTRSRSSSVSSNSMQRRSSWKSKKRQNSRDKDERRRYYYKASRSRKRSHSYDRRRSRRSKNSKNRSRSRERSWSTERSHSREERRKKYRSRSREKSRSSERLEIWKRSRRRGRSRSKEKHWSMKYSRSSEKTRSRDGSRSYDQQRPPVVTSRSKFPCKTQSVEVPEARQDCDLEAKEIIGKVKDTCDQLQVQGCEQLTDGLKDSKQDKGQKMVKDHSKKIQIKIPSTLGIPGLKGQKLSSTPSKVSVFGEWKPVEPPPKRSANLEAWTDFCKMLSKTENEPLVCKDNKDDNYRNATEATTQSEAIRPPFALASSHALQTVNTPIIPNVIMTPAQAIQAGIIIPTFAPSLPVPPNSNIKATFPVSSGEEHRFKESYLGLNEKGAVTKMPSSMDMFPSSVQDKLSGFARYLTGRNKDIYVTRPGFNPIISKDFMHTLNPIQGGIGEKLLQKMGWERGRPLGKRGVGTLNPLGFDVKYDRKGLCSTDEAMATENVGMKGSSHAAIAVGPSGKHPVSSLMELCTKKKWPPPDFHLTLDEGPSHKKCFLFRVCVNSVWYQASSSSRTKKEAKAQTAMVALKALGLAG